MECFVHEGETAVGICKNCSRGVCRTCAIDEGSGVACKGRCEAQVASIAGLVSRNVQVTQNTGGAITIQFVIFLLVGLAGVGLGTFGLIMREWVIAVACFIFGPMMLALAYGQYQWLSTRAHKDKQGT